MAIVDLAVNSEGKSTRVMDVAKRQNISLNYLEHIFVPLKKKGIIKSIRGPGGGYVLSKSSYEIRLSDIVSALGYDIDVTRCGGIDSGLFGVRS